MSSTEKYINLNIKTANLFVTQKTKSAVDFKVRETKSVYTPLNINTDNKNNSGFMTEVLQSPKSDFSIGSSLFSPLPINPLETLSEEILSEVRRYPKNLEDEMN